MCWKIPAGLPHVRWYPEYRQWLARRLYGISPSQYRAYCVESGWGDRYIDVAKLLAKYRSVANKDVNMFSVQTAGYTNVLIPEYTYRANYMFGWTGKEALFADAMIKFWDQKTAQKAQAQNVQQ